jgi:hypothetical protein
VERGSERGYRKRKREEISLAKNAKTPRRVERFGIRNTGIQDSGSFFLFLGVLAFLAFLARVISSFLILSANNLSNTL